MTKITIDIPEGNYNKLKSEGILVNLTPEELASQTIRTRFKAPRGKANPIPEWREFMDVYFDFYENNAGVKPRILGADGKAGKQIIKALRDVGDGEALNNWRAILSRWEWLSPWMQKQVDLKSINSNLNKIIYELRNNKGRQSAVGTSKIKGI